ncbi:MAG: nuclease domain-containing protein [Pikeienuella sp.]
MITNPHMLPKVRSEAIMKAACGEECTLRVSSIYPGYTCAGPETTVGTHLPVFGKGISTKCTDSAVAFGCINCHNIIDGPDKKRRDFIQEKYPSALAMRMLNALAETHIRLIQEGVILIPDNSNAEEFGQ